MPKKILAVLFLMCFACFAEAQDIILPFKHKGLWGLMDIKHRIVMPAILKERTYMPIGKYLKIKDVSDTAYMNCYGIADTSGNILVPAIYQSVSTQTNYFEADYFSSIKWKSSNRGDIYSKSGKKILSIPQFEKVWNQSDGVFKSYLVVQSKHIMSVYKVNWSTAESTLVWSRDSSYFKYASFSNDMVQSEKMLYLNFTTTKGWRKLIIQENGTISENELREIMLTREDGQNFPEAHAIDAEPLFLKQHHGKIFLFKDHRQRNKKLYKVAIERYKSKLNRWDEVNIEQDTSEFFNEIRTCEQGYYVRNGQYWGLMDFNFKLIVPIEYSEIKLPEFRFKERSWYSGEIKDEDLVLVNQKRLWGLYSKRDRKLLIPCLYDSIIAVNRFYYIVKKGKQWGAINEDNIQLIPFKLDGLAWDNNFPVCIAKESGFILAGFEKGKLKLHAPWPSFISDDFDSVKFGGDKMIYVYKNGKVGALCFMGLNEFYTPFLKTEFTLSKDEITYRYSIYYWLETKDKQTAGYVSVDGKYYFINEE